MSAVSIYLMVYSYEVVFMLSISDADLAAERLVMCTELY